MKKEDLDALAGLYEGVYLPNSGEYLSEYAGGQGPSAADLIRQRQAAKQQSQMKGLSIGQGGFRVNNKPVNPGMSPIFQRPGAKPPTRPAATAPATRPAATAPTAKPGTPGSGSKVVPSSAAKPATPAKPAGSAMDQWAAANPKLAAAKAERDRTRGTSATTNPLMKDFKDKLPAPKAPSPTTSTTAFAKSTPALGSSSSAVQSAGSASAAKPTTNQTSTAFSSPSLVKPAAPTSAAKPAATIQKRPSGPGTGAMTRGGASGDVGPNARTIRSSYEWGSKATLKDVASLYSSIYEGKKKDQDKDGDNDFADVRIARMIASGMSKAEAIAAVRSKEYNEELSNSKTNIVEGPGFPSVKPANVPGESGSMGLKLTPSGYINKHSGGRTLPSGSVNKIMSGNLMVKKQTKPTTQVAHYDYEGEIVDEATRMRKELGKEGETATRKELAARSKAYKRSDTIDKTIAAAEREADRTTPRNRNEGEGAYKQRMADRSGNLSRLAASRRKSVRDRPRASMRGYAANVSGADKELQSSRQKSMSAGTLTPKEKKQLGEVYEIVASYLLENNFAATVNDANVIIENMSEVWLTQILESAE
jgi:hypothetical protein